VPGVWIPDEVMKRMSGAPKERQVEEGKRLCIEIIQQVREIQGVSGVLVMAYRQEEVVAEIIERAGILPRHPRANSKPIAATGGPNDGMITMGIDDNAPPANTAV
jgi:methylenetetrahydrofolate reductase (NADPH)